MATHTVKLQARQPVAEGTMAFHLEKPAGFEFRPGQALEVILPGGAQGEDGRHAFSIVSAPHEAELVFATRMRDSAFKRALAALPLGASLDIDGPFGSLTLHKKAERAGVLVAGGIGITPFIPMMREVSAKGRSWTLLYCNRRNEDAPFLAEIKELGGEISLHSSEAGTRLDVAQRLSRVEQDAVIYCCGPERLMVAVEEATTAWPEGSVHFEWFAPRARPADEVSGAFEVVCERSGLTLTVPPEKSVLEALNDAGIEIPCSCQQGICGTCEVRVISGEVDHRDSILSSAERAANQTMMTCVSRAKSGRLVLDV